MTDKQRIDIVALGEPLLELNQTRADARDYLQGFGGDTSNCIIAAARLAGKGGPRTAYVTRIGEAARHCDYFLPSLEDGRSLSGADDIDAVLAWCHDLGPSVVALKLGAEGVLVSSTQGRERIAGHRVANVDATGAGDCFDGAF